MSQKPTLIVVAGPTASGKTALGIRLAQHYDSEIISADSRQFYREMNIGTAKPDPTELAAARHHLINSLSIEEEYSAGQFERQGLQLLEKLFQTKQVAILVGGSGLFIRALCEGLDVFPDIPPEIRQEWQEKFERKGIEVLQQALQELDPEYYKQVDQQNPQRLMRALEVSSFTGQPYSVFRQAQKKERPFNVLYIVLDWERKELYDRINQRVDMMMEKELLEEAKHLYPKRHLNALQTVGYQELFDHFSGKTSLEEAVALIKRNSRRYAKRQLTWFRKLPESLWVHPDKWEQILEWLDRKLEVD